MQFKPLTHSKAINHFSSNISHSEIVKINAIGMIEELISRMSDMDIPDSLYITITMNDEPHCKKEEWDN